MTQAENARILVTGASGFIGRRALAPLRALGFEVHAAARSVPAPETGAAESDRVRWHAADLLAPGGPEALIEAVRPTHLLHLAWYVEHGKFWDAPENLDWLRVTLSLLRAFAEAGGKRFVGAGTCAEYDWSYDRYDEAGTPLRPASLYGAAKASAFLAGSAYARGAGVSFAWGRVFHLFGVGEADARLVPALCRAHLRGGAMECGTGSQVRDFLPAEDVAAALAHLCATEGEAGEGAFNIGSGRPETLRELSERIARLAGRRGDVRFDTRPGVGPARLAPETARLEAAGWKAPASIDDALRVLLASLG